MPDEKRAYLSESLIHDKLQPLKADIIGGMTDEMVHTLTGISVRSIQRWRLKQGLKKPKGFEAKEAAEIYAISTLGEALGDARHRTRRSVIDGRWEPPVFVVREHIDYDLFLRVLEAAHRVLGMNEADLVKALGMSPKTIEQGLAIYARNLNSSTRSCLSCGAKMMQHLEAHYCSTICEKNHGRSE